ncbi:MAG: 4'-phosphopantetheinyl transferase superfamily protein [Oceanospirillaceae bacterium]|nr:4'-phosphopantetheinyl transferase superfamily protein [Oceanospirillaceae bacterium]
MNDLRRLVPGGRWPDDIQLWHLRLPSEYGEADWSTLSADERARAGRYRQPADRIRFALTRCRLRQLLGAWLDLPPASLRFHCNAWGRPELSCGGLSFNVSHSGSHALIAISACRRVGVDVEWIDPALAWQALSGLLCTAAELRSILESPGDRRRWAFFRYWTAKEALLKAQGQGIGAGLHAVNLAEGETQPMAMAGATAPVADCRLRYCWLDELEGYGACLAYGEPGSDGLQV